MVNLKKELISREISAPKTTKKLLDKMLDAIVENTKKGLTVIIGSFEDNFYKIIS